jgi:hypothetical protein
MSVISAVVIELLWPRPSLSQFLYRPATESENIQADKWAKDWGPGPHSETDFEKNVDMYLMWTSIAYRGGLPKEHPVWIKIQYVARYHILPFVTGALAIWFLYALIRFLIVGYVIEGFKGDR